MSKATTKVSRRRAPTTRKPETAKRKGSAGHTKASTAGIRRTQSGSKAGLQGGSRGRGGTAASRGNARDADLWSDEGGRGTSLSPFLDVIRGLGRETEGVRIQEARLLSMEDLTALGHDGIARNCYSIKVEQALAPGHTLQILGVESKLAQQITKDATELFIGHRSQERVKQLGIAAKHYGSAVKCSSWKWDKGVDDLDVPLMVARQGARRWSQVWDLRDYQVRGVAGSTSEHYRAASWLDLTPYNPSIDYDRLNGGGRGGMGRSTGDTSRVTVHPSRYVRLTTASGYSVLQESAQYIANLLLAGTGGAALMQRASAGIFELDELESQTFAGGDESRAKLQAQFEAWSAQNVMMLAAGEKFQLPGLTIAGIEGGIYSSAYLLSAARRIPLVILLGASPGSFVSGEAQTVQWHEVLDEIWDWLLPALYSEWDDCIAEVTGGPIPDYQLVRNPYEVMDPSDSMTQKLQALELAKNMEAAGYIGREAAIAGLTTTAGEDFDMETALAVPRPEVPETPKVDIEVGKVQAIAALVTQYAADPTLTPGPFRALAAASVPAYAAVVDQLFPDRAPIVAVPATGVASAGVPEPGVQSAPTAAGAPATKPTPDASAASEPWLPPKIIKRQYSIGASTLKSMRTAFPGQQAEEGEIEWLQTPAGHARYRESDVLRLLRAGRVAPDPNASEESEDPEDSGEDVLQAPDPTPDKTRKPRVLRKPAKDSTSASTSLPSNLQGKALDGPRNGKGSYVWRTMQDDKVRPAHAEREGVTFAWGDPPSDGHPGQPGNCRCWAEPLELAGDTTSNANDSLPREGWPVDGLQWRMTRQSDESGVSGVGVVVRGLVMCDGSVVSWWCTPGKPPRPHIDAAWSDFYAVHIEQHPSNGSIIEQCNPDGGWSVVADVSRGPCPRGVVT